MKLEPRIAELLERLGGVEPSVGNKFNPLIAKDIKEIEQAVGGSIPSTLRGLLTSLGSFRFKQDVFYVPTSPFPKTYSRSNRGIVGTFLGKKHTLYPRARSVSLLHRLQLLKDELPKHFLPMADNGAGDLLGISLDSGSVQLWNHEGAEGDDSYPVNNSFDDWLSSLKPE